MNSENKRYLLIIIFLIIGVFIFSYLNYDVYFNDKNQENSKDKEQERLEQLINGSSDNVEELIDEKKVEEDLVNIIESELYILDDISNIKDISNADKLSLAYFLYEKNEEDNIKSYDQSFSKDLLEKYYKNSSLGDLDITYDNITCYKATDLDKHILWNYKDGVYTYNQNHGGHGYATSIALAYHVSSLEIDKDKYIISLKYIWSDVLEGFSSTNVYGSYQDAFNKTNSLGEVSSDEDIEDASFQFLDNNYIDIKDKLDTYIYTFSKKDDNYKLIDFKLEKNVEKKL